MFCSDGPLPHLYLYISCFFVLLFCFRVLILDFVLVYGLWFYYWCTALGFIFGVQFDRYDRYGIALGGFGGYLCWSSFTRFLFLFTPFLIPIFVILPSHI
ncbi:hypothetical protein M501DRAFT_596168 [Patellaria atrata CBS 101060]|uniref:Uncharacterized protein n=1 Tax=Patellaria atrata CBS 101060 TaxID=1346257 RepID=A0A9P4S1A1_9PEZI|nr:hypothetical protein M501DRAFT_596168 [Patellaria atrata CBS 101060]